MKMTHPAHLLVAATLLTVLPSAVSAAVVYDNTTVANLQPSAFRTGLEYGDEIKLAGSDRFVTEFVVGYFGDFTVAPSATGILRLYANDGTDAIPGAQVALRPKSVLWESAPFSLSANNQEVIVTPNIGVPDSFTWSIKFEGLGNVAGNSAALSVVNPVTVGGVLSNGAIGSFNDFWIKNGATDDSWALNQLANGTIPANFYARVTAVPEPSVIALGVFGVAGLWLSQRRRQIR